MYVELAPVRAPEPQERAADGMGDEERKRFGASVKAARAELGLTQKQVGDAVGISQGFVSKIEQGQYDMTFDVMAAVARVLGIEVTFTKQ